MSLLCERGVGDNNTDTSGGSISHANARLTPAGRLLLVERIEAGTTQAEVARQMGLSRGTVAKWWHRWCSEGEAGLVDRSSRPHRSPARTAGKVEERICRLRRSTKRGPAYLAARTGVPPSTMWQVLKRHGLNRLSWMDRPTGRVIRRYERSAPGELVHLDVKKVGKVPPGGGWRVHGRGSPKTKRRRRKRRGCTYLHVAIDDYSRVAYVETLDNETADTLLGFWRRAQGWFWSNDMAVDEVLTDNGPNFTSAKFADLLAERAIKHRRTQPYRPQTNGKQNASTAPWPTSSSTPGCSDQKPTAGSASLAGATTTTATDTTPPSADRPHHEHTTSLEPTASHRLGDSCEASVVLGGQEGALYLVSERVSSGERHGGWEYFEHDPVGAF